MHGFSFRPAPINRAGECCVCGDKLDFYDNKFVEKREPHRLLGALCKCGTLLERYNFYLNEQKWDFYTDG